MIVHPHITVFVPGYNVEAWITRCLSSVHDQRYPFFNVVMVNDASTDKTGELMEKFADSKGGRVIHNLTNQRMPHNLVHLREGNPDHVIVIVDADDFLPHNQVLSAIAQHYEDPELWLMYGSYARYPDPTFMPNPALPFPDKIIERRDFRAYSQIALIYNHPLTFRRKLLNEISDAEMQDDEGVWFPSSYDHVIMMPMLELAANGHFKWNPDILYTYNEENMESEAKSDKRMEGVRVHQIVNARPKRITL